jgi:predicted neutral ceramidase superfamily lipid hydrolase
MVAVTGESEGVSGTISAFNFIRRVGFPPTPEIVSAFATLPILAAVIALPLSGLGLGPTLLIAIAAMILPTLVGEFLNSVLFLRGEAVFSFRRLMGLEVLSWSPILFFLPITSGIGVYTGDRTLWVDGFLLTLILSLPLRFLAVFAMSPFPFWRKFISSALVPAASFRVYAQTSLLLSIKTRGEIYLEALVFLLGIFLATGGVIWIIRGVEKAGSPDIGDSPMGLFRDFLLHWLEKDPNPLEHRLSSLGRTGKIDVAILAFETPRPEKACVIVSNFHPGPYRDLGSGGLPSRLKASIQSRMNSTTLVPHGISNHEYNIISQEDVQKLIEETWKRYPIVRNSFSASRFVRETVEEAKASAQAFGNTVFVTLTLAPKDMEDVPPEVLGTIEAEAKAKGLRVMVADAHNSLSRQVSITPEQARMLSEAARKAMIIAAQPPQSRFKVGSASDPLSDFGLSDGIGPGGLSVVAVESQSQLTAYLTIDGNNMETGFREMILATLTEEGVDDGEVMTTDTHLVAGVVRSKLGYHPVGENMNKDLFLRKVRETVRTAMNAMEYAGAGMSSFSLELRVLGSTSFQTITLFVGRVAKGLGRTFLRLELAVFAVSILLLVI